MDNYTLMKFLCFHTLSRSIWWSPNPTSSEIPGVDGEPQSAESWLCISKEIRSFSAEVGLPWPYLSLLLPPPGLGPVGVEAGKVFQKAKSSPYTWKSYFFEGERRMTSLPFCYLSPYDFFCCQSTGTNHFVQKHGLHGMDGPMMAWLCWWNILATNRKNTKWDG